MENANLLNDDIDNILKNYDLSNISSNFEIIDEIIQSVLEILEQFYENLDYGDIYNKILKSIESKNESNDYENIDDLQLIEVNGETYENLDSMKNELLKTQCMQNTIILKYFRKYSDVGVVRFGI